jgi:hypothetical protein
MIKPKPDRCERCGHEVDLGDDVMLIGEYWICQGCAYEAEESEVEIPA